MPFLVIASSSQILTAGFVYPPQCGSSRSVAPIKAGFVAQVGRRKAGT